jgi:hypothetical protein
MTLANSEYYFISRSLNSSPDLDDCRRLLNLKKEKTTEAIENYLNQ